MKNHVVLVLTPAQAQIFRKLLSQAGDQLSNNGCNDFVVANELGVSEEEGKRIGKEMLARMVIAQVVCEEMLQESGAVLEDWLLLAYFEKCLEDAMKVSSS